MPSSRQPVQKRTNPTNKNPAGTKTRAQVAAAKTPVANPRSAGKLNNSQRAVSGKATTPADLKGLYGNKTPAQLTKMAQQINAEKRANAVTTDTIYRNSRAKKK